MYKHLRLFCSSASKVPRRNLNDYLRRTILDPSHGLTSDEKQLQDLAKNFAVNEFRPHRQEWDSKEIFPVETLRKAAALGFGGLYIPTEHCGTGLSRLETSIVIEALSQGCVSTAAYISIHNMVVGMISQFGNDDQRSKYIPDLVSMNRFGSYCLTEPDSGSDAASLKSTAVRKGDYYVLNGSKAFISGSGNDNIYLIMCRTGASGPKGISCLIVDGDVTGLSLGKKEKKLGWNSHPARIITLEDVKVPATNLLGSEGFGFNIAMLGLNGGRTNIASCSLGGAQWAIEETIEYTTTRKQFGQYIADFQNTQFKLADMASEIFAIRLVVRAAAKEIDIEKDYDDLSHQKVSAASAAAAAKLLATEKCFTIIDNCLQVMLHHYVVTLLI